MFYNLLVWLKVIFTGQNHLRAVEKICSAEMSMKKVECVCVGGGDLCLSSGF